MLFYGKNEFDGIIMRDEKYAHNDKYLLSALCKGDREAFDCIFRKYYVDVVMFCGRFMNRIEDSEDIDGVLLLLNTMGGDVEAGLAIAEMIASLSKPTVSLVLGGSHSIGVPIAVSTDYSFIVPTGTMVIHPVRMNGMVIGVPQTFDYFRQIQNRITGFVCSHCKISKNRFEELMMETGVLTKDVGTILVGEEAVSEGIINETGGISEAMKKLHSLIGKQKKQKQ